MYISIKDFGAAFQSGLGLDVDALILFLIQSFSCRLTAVLGIIVQVLSLKFKKCNI